VIGRFLHRVDTLFDPSAFQDPRQALFVILDWQDTHFLHILFLRVAQNSSALDTPPRISSCHKFALIDASVPSASLAMNGLIESFRFLEQLRSSFSSRIR
jgi:hypothetical protein